MRSTRQFVEAVAYFGQYNGSRWSKIGFHHLNLFFVISSFIIGGMYSSNVASVSPVTLSFFFSFISRSYPGKYTMVLIVIVISDLNLLVLIINFLFIFSFVEV